MNCRNNRYPRFRRSLLVSLLFISLLVVFEARATLDPQVPQGDHRPWAIHGAIVTEEGAKDGWLLFDRAGISCVQCSESKIPKDARIIKYDGYIFPGLIDAHNHAPWNVLPQWRAKGGRTFKSRYEWLTDEEYRQKVNDVFYKQIRDANLEYAALKYAEVRGLVGGTTLIQTSYSTVQPDLLVRNLDVTYGADSRIPDITKVTEEEIHRFRVGLASGKLRRIFLHVAEGSDQKCKDEFSELKAHGLLRPGVVVIHGIALTRQDFKEMSRAEMFLVWSPKSNEVLYKQTAKVLDALEEGVTVALAPDWTITGSDNVLEEIKVGHEYSQKHLGGKITALQLFKMTTSDAARVAGVEERLGRLAFGYAADFFLAPKLDSNPFESLIKTYPRHIHLVFIDGVPLYGDPEELGRWEPTDALDIIQVDNSNKAIFMKGDPRSAWHSQQRYEELLQILRGALPSVAKLIED